jgi:hypothetical protein
MLLTLDLAKLQIVVFRTELDHVVIKWQVPSCKLSELSSFVRDQLSKLSCSIFQSSLGTVEFVPEVLLNFGHIAPGRHSVGFNITYLILILTLNFLVAFNKSHVVCFFRSLDYHCRNFLRGRNFLNFSLFLESLRNDLG